MLPATFGELQKFTKISIFGCMPGLIPPENFLTAHKQTRDLHRWIAIDLIYIKKLPRGETNLQISRYLHFSAPFTPIFDSPFEIKFPLPLYYSRAGFLRSRATSFLVERPSLTGTVLPSPSLPDPSHKYSIVFLLLSGRPRRAAPEHRKI